MLSGGAGGVCVWRGREDGRYLHVSEREIVDLHDDERLRDDAQRVAEEECALIVVRARLRVLHLRQ
jgi:hypothetical protein